jgi:uncharacterized protein YegL
MPMTTRLHWISIAVTTALLAGQVAAAPSPTTMVHDGASDPTTEGWSHSAGTNPGSVESGSETTTTGKHAFWRIEDRILDGWQAYRWPLPPDAATKAWRFSAVLRIVDSPVITFHDGVGGTGVVVADGQHYWSFYFTNTQVGPVGKWAGSMAAYHLARTFELDTRSDYHEYGILFDPVGPGAADDSADFFIDGRLVFDDVTRQDLFETPSELLHFGSTSRPGTSDARYQWICFEGDLSPEEARIPPSAGRGCGVAPTPTATAPATDEPTSTSIIPTATVTPTATISPTMTASATPTASTTPTDTPTAPPPPTVPPCVPSHQASDIALVLDRSSSMNSANKLGAAVAAINQFVDGVRAPPDQLALVTFSDVAGLNQPLTSDKAAFRRALGAVVTGNGTRIDLGLQRAREELLGVRHMPDHAPVLILLSDGVQADGEGARVTVEADAARAAGIVVFTIAFGADADIDLLRLVATSPAHAFVAPTNADLARIYERIAAAIPCPPTATATPVVATAMAMATETAAATASSEPTPVGNAAVTALRRFIYLPIVGSPNHDVGSIAQESRH